MAASEHQWDQLPQLFPKILHLWKEAPAHNNWAMEKLMEIFCKYIAPDLNLVQSVGFPAFLDGFFESGQLIQYPDFVLINVALMAGEVLLTLTEYPQEEDMKEKAFQLIRYPLQYWLVNKGHNAHVTFQILSKLVQHRGMLSTLDNFSFDLQQAVAYAIASPHNYTRKSACTYCHALVQFAFHKTDQDKDTQAKLRVQITACIEAFARRLNQNQARSSSSVEGGSLYPGDNNQETIREAKVRLSQLVCQPACTSQEWLEAITSEGIFTLILELCCQIAEAERGDGEGLYITCAQILIRLQSSSLGQEEWNRHYQLFLQVLKILCQQGSAASVSEVLSVAHTLLVGLGNARSTEGNLLLELSILPLFVLVSAVPGSLHEFSPEIIAQVKCMMVNSNMSRSQPLMKEAVKNLYSILENETIYSQEYERLLKYLSFQELREPANITKALLGGTQLKNGEVVNFLQYSFSYLQDLESKSRDHVENILKVLECFMKYPRLTHGHIQVAMDCYIKLIKDEGIMNRQVTLSFLQILQLKMVDLDPNTQEVAVKAVGKLILIDGIDATSEQMLRCAKALWECIQYKNEEVASQVLAFLLHASNIGKLDSFLCSVSVTKADVVQKAEEFLVSGHWDNIKPVAFKLLSKLCTADKLLKYAQASFRRYNAQLRVVVLDHIKIMCEEIYSKQSLILEQVEKVIALLATGWGDLLLDKAVSVETCNFRQVSVIMEHLLAFMDRKDVSHYIDSAISDLLQDDLSNNFKGDNAFLDICDVLLSSYGHTVKRCNEELGNGHEAMQNESFSDTPCQGEPPNKKIKWEGTPLHDAVSLNESLSFKAQHLLNKVLSEGKVADKVTYMKHKNVTEATEDDAFDSTKELAPLEIANEQALSRKLVLDSLSTEATTESERLCDIITWLVYKEILHRLQPEALTTEAEQSTDEYERNCSLLLHDFHQLLNKSFTDMKEDLMEELIAVILTRFSDILSQYEIGKSMEDGTSLLRRLISFVQILNTISNKVDKFCNFVFNHRKSVMLRPMQIEESQFVLDSFLERLQALQCSDVRHLLVKDTYPSKEGLSLLLDEFCQEHRETPTDCSGNDQVSTVRSTGNSCCDSEANTPRDNCSREKLEQIISSACNKVARSSFSILDRITFDDSKILYDTVNKDFDFSTPEDALNKILSEDKRYNFSPVLVFMKMLLKKIILDLFENDTQLKNSGKEESVRLFSQLETWFLSEREFDSDNDDDPSALDCV